MVEVSSDISRSEMMIAGNWYLSARLNTSGIVWKASRGLLGARMSFGKSP